MGVSIKDQGQFGAKVKSSIKLALCKSFWATIFLLFLMSPCVSAAQSADLKQAKNDRPKKRKQFKQSSQLSADQATWEWDKARFNLSGNVSLQLQLAEGVLTLKCQQAKIYLKTEQATQQRISIPELNQDSFYKLEVEGTIKLRFEALTIKAQRIDYDHLSGWLVARGDIQGQWKSNRLTGKDLRLNLKQGNAELLKPNLRFIWAKEKLKQSIWGR